MKFNELIIVNLRRKYTPLNQHHVVVNVNISNLTLVIRHGNLVIFKLENHCSLDNGKTKLARTKTQLFFTQLNDCTKQKLPSSDPRQLKD